MGEGDEVSSHDRCVVEFYESMQVFEVPVYAT